MSLGAAWCLIFAVLSGVLAIGWRNPWLGMLSGVNLYSALHGIDATAWIFHTMVWSR